jgi:diguanylate cyclase (GGDEF)-like protein
MSERIADVLLVTDDPQLQEAVAGHQPPGARLQSIDSAQLNTAHAPRARHVWIDLDSGASVPTVSGRRRVYFHTEQPPKPDKRPPGLYIRKPCTAAVLEVLWAGVDVKPGKASKPAPRSAGRPLPAWILDFHELDLKALCRKCITNLGPRLGYRDVSLYLHDAPHDLLTLAETTHTRPVDLTVRFDAESKHLMAAVARTGRLLRTDRASTELKTRQIERHPDRAYPDDDCLVVPLINDDQLWGVLSFSGCARTAQTELGLPLDEIFAFVSRALGHARTYEQARLEARVDGLTGLFNQRWMTEALEKEIRRAQRFNTPLSLLMLDLDGLKTVNDQVGHAAGDCLLRHVASRIGTVLRQFDGAARVGGDEFVVMLPSTGLKGARQVARRLLQSIREDVAHFGDTSLPITASVGAAEWSAGWDARKLIEVADQAMYAAKRQGRNTLVCQPPEQLASTASGDLSPAAPTRFTTAPVSVSPSTPAAHECASSPPSPSRAAHSPRR